MHALLTRKQWLAICFPLQQYSDTSPRRNVIKKGLMTRGVPCCVSSDLRDVATLHFFVRTYEYACIKLMTVFRGLARV